MLQKLNSKKSFMVAYILLLITLTTIVSSSANAASVNYFFRLKILTKSDNESLTIANFIQQELQKISIDSTIISYPSGAFEAAVVSKEFDIVMIDLEWPSKDVDPTYIFSKDGASNYWGIDLSIDGGPLNEELLAEGRLETDESNRISIYHNWQENLMANILPIIPLYNSITSFVTWDTLSGWDHTKGIIASLPYMEWTAAHTGQLNTSTFIDYTSEWDILNPLFIEDDYYSSLIHEPLFRIDNNGNLEPILAESWNFNSNKTILSLKLRENVYWQPDIDEIYTTELFTSSDVDFSISMYQNLSTIGTFFKWVNDIDIINATHLDIYIDGNKTANGLQPYAPALFELDKLLLPEHYLNVSVGVDGLPDTTNENWNNFANYGLGTGMYYLDSFTDGVESIFNKNDNWWGTRPDAFNDDLDIATYIIRFLGTSIENNLIEFQSGQLDIYRDYRKYMTELSSTPYQKQTNNDYDVTYLGFNLKSSDTPEISDETLCEDETMTRGLAVRKAIAHMIDKTAINGLLNIESEIINSPLSSQFDSFIKNNITDYSTDLQKAKEFMQKAGYDPATLITPGFSFITPILSVAILTSAAIIIKSKKKKNHN